MRTGACSHLGLAVQIGRGQCSPPLVRMGHLLSWGTLAVGSLRVVLPVSSRIFTA